ncbi:hypothetical protein [Arcicella rosea]|uniref:Outer membrane protein beta-barrel domain-containing protein n=1 Tax=Arcicella rosea TaxID=502909 RepID=A0A841EGR5_9BACT|nr:hypothetical protein [Arcicella rosea]MBB6002176.1 hypothetical protein [Arcicella rosea]
MSDKWWDMSDDELDDLFREASDKVQIPFDQSSLDKLNAKIATKPLTGSRFKYERGLLLLLLLVFVGGGIGFYLRKNYEDKKIVTQKSELINTLPTKTNIQSKEVVETELVSNKSEENKAKKLNKVQKTTSSITETTQTLEGNHKNISISKLKERTVEEKTIKNKSAESKKTFIQQSNRNISTFDNGETIIPVAVNTILTKSQQLNGNTTLALLKSKELKPLKTNFEVILPAFEQESEKASDVRPLVPIKRFNRFGIRLAIAPDANAIEKLEKFAFGKSAGILFEYNLTKRFVLQTGAIYTYKKYNTGIENYHAWAKNWATRPVLPTSVEGDCEILDIPINIRYNLLLQPKSTWFVSAGVSSYLMLTEGYEYYYPETATVPINFPRYVTWKRDNDYFTSILNISFGFEKKINQHISIQAEPYLKAPLKEVGRGKVNLYSSGVLFSLKYGF